MREHLLGFAHRHANESILSTTLLLLLSTVLIEHLQRLHGCTNSNRLGAVLLLAVSSLIVSVDLLVGLYCLALVQIPLSQVPDILLQKVECIPEH